MIQAISLSHLHPWFPAITLAQGSCCITLWMDKETNKHLLVQDALKHKGEQKGYKQLTDPEYLLSCTLNKHDSWEAIIKKLDFHFYLSKSLFMFG